MAATSHPETCPIHRQGAGEGAPRIYRYRSNSELERTLQAESAGNRYGTRLTFCCVPPAVIEQLCDERSGHTIKDFDKTDKTIEIAMPTDIHESATAVARKMTDKALIRAKMRRAMREVGRETIFHGVDQMQGKEPDVAYRLKLNYARKYDLKKYPQIIIETGYGCSETSRDTMSADVRHWLQQGNRAVRLVLAVRATENSFELSAWTLSNRKRHVTHEGEISATLDKNGSFKLRRGSAQKIVIPFAIIFLREPDRACREKDVEFKATDFLDCCDELEEAYRDGNPWGQEKPPLPPPRSKRGIPMDAFSDELVKPKKKAKTRKSKKEG